MEDKHNILLHFDPLSNLTYYRHPISYIYIFSFWGYNFYFYFQDKILWKEYAIWGNVRCLLLPLWFIFLGNCFHCLKSYWEGNSQLFYPTPKVESGKVSDSSHFLNWLGLGNGMNLANKALPLGLWILSDARMKWSTEFICYNSKGRSGNAVLIKTVPATLVPISQAPSNSWFHTYPKPVLIVLISTLLLK